MATHNTKFELSIGDIELIETALQLLGQDLSSQLIAADGDEPPTSADETQRQIQALLGRLHNQKVFYRPQSSAYLGG